MTAAVAELDDPFVDVVLWLIRCRLKIRRWRNRVGPLALLRAEIEHRKRIATSREETVVSLTRTIESLRRMEQLNGDAVAALRHELVTVRADARRIKEASESETARLQHETLRLQREADDAKRALTNLITMVNAGSL